MSFDLNTLDTKKAAEAGYTHQLENPFTHQPMFDDAKQPYFIRVLGGDSGQVSEVMRNIADRRLEYIQKTRKIVTESELTHQEDVELIASAIVDWYLPELDGKTWPFSRENAKTILSDPRFPWIMEQLQKVIGDRAHFFKKNSSA
jgi:hypothetical protein